MTYFCMSPKLPAGFTFIATNIALIWFLSGVSSNMIYHIMIIVGVIVARKANVFVTKI
jgi:hypothetical protein